MVMATQKLDTLFPGPGYHPLKLRSMYSDGVASFVFGDFNPQKQGSDKVRRPQSKGRKHDRA